MTAPAIVTDEALAALLGGTPKPELVTLCAAAASEALAAVVDPPPDPLPDPWAWPAGVTLAGLGVAADAYKSLSAPGGGYQMDELTVSDAFRIVSTLLRRYEPFYNPSRAVGGMVG